ADVRVIQRRSGLRLTFEALQRYGVASQLFRQKLQRDAAPELEVLCLVHHPHAATADDFEYSIMSNLSADEVGRKSAWWRGIWLVTARSLLRRFQPLDRDH